MRSLITATLTLAITLAGYAQTGIVQGRITDARTLKPLPYATVYLNQTTIGASTNNEGDYELKSVPPGRYDLVISYVGYQTYQARIVVTDSATTHISIKLIPSATNLAEVTVTAKKDDKWKSTFRKFEKYFFGVSQYTEQCKILNPWVLDFKEDSEGNITAKASAPLRIENVGLGYNITSQLRECVVGPTMYKIIGVYRFEEAMTMDTTLNTLWQKRREDVYLGSPRHLLKAIVENRVVELGYRLYIEKSNAPEIFRSSTLLQTMSDGVVAEFENLDFAKPSDNDGQYIVTLPARTEVHYLKKSAPAKIYRGVPFPVSWLEVDNGPLEVAANGVLMNPTRLTVLGAMGDPHIAELLPINFELSTKESAYKKPVVQHSKLAALLEKPYIMTDKPYYYPSDAILFKTFVNYIAPAFSDSLSRVMNVELIDETGNIIRKKMFPIVGGAAVGDFTLSGTMAPGNYSLRAWSKWMLNFDKGFIFYKPIKVLPHDRLGVVHQIQAQSKQLIIIAEKEEFETREQITLAVEASNFYGDPIAANLSISVVDIEQAAIPSNETNILWHFPFTTAMLPDTSLKVAKHPIQYGIDFKGRMVLGKKNKPTNGAITVYQDKIDDVFALTTDEAGNFHAQLQLMDSSELFLDPKTSKGKKAKVIVEEIPDLTPPVEVGDTLVLDTYRPADASKYHTPDLFSAAKMLEEVTIRAKRIEKENSERNAWSDTFVEGDRLRATSATDLLSALRIMVPGLRIVYVSDGSGGVRKIITFPSNFGMNGFEEALILMDGQVLGGIQSAADVLSVMTTEEVENVEIARYGMAAAYGARGANGVISIRTRRGQTTSGARQLDRTKFQVVQFAGYSKTEEFVAPDYSAQTSGDDRLDLRSTIYWNPYIASNGKDPYKISFFAADIPTQYRIVIEGVTADGEPVRGEKIIVVKSKK